MDSEPLEYAPGRGCIYSDLGYMVLGLILEKVGGMPLDRLFSRRILEPAGLKNLFFLPFKPGKENPLENIPLHTLAPTEACPWRKTTLHGQVHDDNAWTLGGVAGHAGLFGTALGVWGLIDVIRRTFHGDGTLFPVSRTIVKRFLEGKPGPGSYVLGYDTPTPPESSSGTAFFIQHGGAPWLYRRFILGGPVYSGRGGAGDQSGASH